MRPDPIPEQYKEEAARVRAIWLKLPDEVSYEDTVKLYAEPKYRRYFLKKADKTRRLRKKGVYVD